MSLVINHNISIVPILDLKNVSHYTISRQTSNEVESCITILFRIFVAIFLQEVLVKINFESFSKLISTVRVRNNFNQPTKFFICSSSVADTLIRHYIQIKTFLFKNMLEKFNYLQG